MKNDKGRKRLAPKPKIGHPAKDFRLSNTHPFGSALFRGADPQCLSYSCVEQRGKLGSGRWQFCG